MITSIVRDRAETMQMTKREMLIPLVQLFSSPCQRLPLQVRYHVSSVKLHLTIRLSPTRRRWLPLGAPGLAHPSTEL